MRVLLFQTFLFLIYIPLFSQPDVAAFDRYVEQAAKQWEVPGLAVAVVKDGKVLMAKGYGVRKLGEPGQVNAQTIYGICSTTKAMTAAAMAILVDEGKVAWDDPVIKHLPRISARRSVRHPDGPGAGLAYPQRRTGERRSPVVCQ
ncbi:MAG: serine hydrolase [Haliscomenobacter sp.]|nr:serine hydrolase [Haliscomenobacter sp.]